MTLFGTFTPSKMKQNVSRNKNFIWSFVISENLMRKRHISRICWERRSDIMALIGSFSNRITFELKTSWTLDGSEPSYCEIREVSPRTALLRISQNSESVFRILLHRASTFASIESLDIFLSTVCRGKETYRYTGLRSRSRWQPYLLREGCAIKSVLVQKRQRWTAWLYQLDWQLIARWIRYLKEVLWHLIYQILFIIKFKLYVRKSNKCGSGTRKSFAAVLQAPSQAWSFWFLIFFNGRKTFPVMLS